MPTRRALLTLLAAAAASACSVAAGRSRSARWSTCRSSTAAAARRSRPGAIAAPATSPAGPATATRCASRNRSPGRVLVVLSVDGVNAVSGETAAVAQTGYVLAPYQSAEITGWRKSYSEAAAFYFTALPDSYAARTGRPDNVGVIGAAVFRERVAEPAAAGSSRRRRSAKESARRTAGAGAPAPQAPAATADAAQRRTAAGAARARDARPRARREQARHRPRRARIFADDPDRLRARHVAAGRDRAGALRQLRQPARERRHPAAAAAAAPPDAFPSFVPDPV